MQRGFVFGKFYPFHVGHEALIRFARSKCDELIVLVCVSDRELISAEQRLSWFQKTYAGDPQIKIQTLQYREDELPNTSVSSEIVSKLWSERFRKELPPVNLVVTAEDYGDYVARFLGIEHRRFELPKHISATMIRNDLQKHWESLNKVAREDLLTKVVILGTESSGKSTLAQYLARRFGGGLVTEVGRDLVPDSAACTPHDLEDIAKAHAERIEKEAAQATRVLFIDTDIHTTMSYSEFLFGKQLAVSPELRAANKAHLYLYLDNDAPFVQDGTRLDEEQRNALDVSHRRVLEREGIEYQVLRGTWEEKYEQAARLVEYTLSLRYPWSQRIILPPVPRFDESVERDAAPHPGILRPDDTGRETPLQP